MPDWPKVMNFVNSHGILPLLPPNCTKFVSFFATTKKLIIRVESLHFPVFSTKCREYKIKKRDGHGKLRNCHGKVMEEIFVHDFSMKISQVCGNPALGTYFSFLQRIMFPRVYNSIPLY